MNKYFKMLSIVAVAAAVSGCQYAKSKPKYQMGEMVLMKAFNIKGMVVDNYCPSVPLAETPPKCNYTLRFSAIENNTNTHLVGSDGPISVSPVSLVYGIREFELESLK